LLLAAVSTQAVYDHVAQVGIKPVPGLNIFTQGAKHIITAFYPPSAAAANQMMVMPFVRMVVNSPVIHLAFYHTAGVFQKLQSAVNGGTVDIRKFFLNLAYYLLGSQVGRVRMNNIHHQLALESELVTGVFQNIYATHS